jgi:hypothetical protein
LSGTPSVAGAFDFTVQAAGGTPRQTATQALRLTIDGPLSITTPAALPDAAPSVPYTFALVAAGGMAPYTWTATGRLPNGLALSSAGVLSGTPTTVGNFTFAIEVTDSFTPRQRATRNFTLTVSQTLTIVTTSLPGAFQNTPYSQQLAAAGGQSPFAWLVTAGALPAGLTLSPAGLIQGTATTMGQSTFTVTVTDARGNTNAREFTVRVDPALAPLSISGFPVSLNPTQSAGIDLVLSAPHPSPLTGQLALSFTPRAENPSDDPMTQFSSGSRSVNFTIPANSSNAVFASPASLLTGTVAGTVRITANIDNGPKDVLVASVEVATGPPQMTNIVAVRTSGGLDVRITGYAPARRVTSVEFTFAVRTGSGTQNVTLLRNVDPDFTTWYRNPTSATYGSAFSYVQSFSIQGGDVGAIESVTIRLTNAQGSTTSDAVHPQ